MFELDYFSWFGSIFKIVVTDIVLSADNAVIIALACRSLRPNERRVAYVAGTIGAVALRLLFATGIVFLLDVPFLKLLGGVILLIIAIHLVVEELPHQPDNSVEKFSSSADTSRLWRVVIAILIGDIAMSLDNVVAVAALANGSFILLAFGLTISIPLLVFGSTLLRNVLDGHAVLVLMSGMLLGWVGGSIAISDVAVSVFVTQQAPALAISLPAGGALIVLCEALILRRRTSNIQPKL